MELKIPPAVVTLAAAALMWTIDNNVNDGWLEFAGSQWVSLSLFIVGSLLGFAGLIQFFIKSTSVNPHIPDNARVLVKEGVYGISRNPMYLGLLFILIAFAFYLGSMLSLVVLPFFVGYMNWYQIIPEEKILSKKFGKTYRKYKERVRRWL
jgi:protein-S-isoprenylcysteine O-methyltransferase Ste14